MASTSSSSPKVSLMSLPAEVRLLIYRYLLPGTPCDRLIHGDMKHCAPALLRANRTIYDEYVGVLYGSVQWPIFISVFGALFPSGLFPGTALPSVCNEMKSLRIVYDLRDPVSHSTLRKWIQGFISSLDHSFASATSMLKDLCLEVVVPPDLAGLFIDRRDEFDDVMHCQLSPLQNIIKKADVFTIMVHGNHKFDTMGNDQLGAMDSTVQDYVMAMRNKRLLTMDQAKNERITFSGTQLLL